MRGKSARVRRAPAKTGQSKRRGFSWKAFRESSRTKKKAKRYVFLSLLLLLSAFALLALFAYKGITVPFASAESSTASDFINKRFVTVVYATVADFKAHPLLVERVSFVLVDKEAKKAYEYEIPLSLTVDVPGKFGVESFEKILALGLVSGGDIRIGAGLLIKAVEKLFGYKVDRYIVQEEGTRLSFQKFLEGRMSLMDFEAGDIVQFGLATKTDFSISELYEIYRTVGFTSASGYEPKRFAEDFYSDSYKIDTEMRNISLGSQIAAERKSVAILNGTQIPGLAILGARAAGNMGAEVIVEKNARAFYDKSILVVDSQDSETAMVLGGFFNIDIVLTKEEAAYLSEDEAARADVTVIIGLDTAMGM